MRYLFVISLLLLSVTQLNGEQLYFVFLNTNPDKPKIDSAEIVRLQNEHLANITRLYDVGKIVAAGPFEGGGGIFIFRADSLEEVNKLLNTDPAIHAKRFITKVHQWNQRVGGICKLGSDYSMTTYTFIHYQNTSDTKKKSGNTVTFYHSLLDICDNHIVAEGSFASGGGIMILKPEHTKLIKKIERFFSSYDLSTSVKSLWIAKGTFCED